MAAAPPLRVVLGALAAELDRLHADALRLQDELSALTDDAADEAAGRLPSGHAGLEGLQRLDALTQGLQVLGGFTRSLAAAAPAGSVDFGALERPVLSDMAARLGWPAAVPAPVAGEDGGCEIF